MKETSFKPLIDKAQKPYEQGHTVSPMMPARKMGATTKPSGKAVIK